MILLKKIFRDLRTNRAANIAATVLISIALMIFTFMSNVNESLNLSKDTFYKDSSFADIFSDVRAFLCSRGVRVNHSAYLIKAFESL